MKAVTAFMRWQLFCAILPVCWMLDAGCKKGRRYVILKAVQGHMINMALFYHVYEVGVKDS
jgi:hypothetical protein